MGVTSDDVRWASTRLEHYARECLHRERWRIPVDPWARERLVADIMHDARQWASIHNERARMDAVLAEIRVGLHIDPSDSAPFLRIRWSPDADAEPFTPYDVDFANGGGAFADASPGRVYVGFAPDDGAILTIEEALAFGHALLAAADEAERLTSPESTPATSSHRTDARRA